jgi:hypothetical protein
VEESDSIQYDPEQLPSQVDAETLLEVRGLRSDMQGVADNLVLLTQSENDAQSAEVASEVVISSEQYEYLQRSMQMLNSSLLLVLVLLALACGLSGWRAFVHSWGSHG